MKQTKYFIFLLIILTFNSIKCQEISLKDFRWSPVDASGNVSGRHENGFVKFKDKFYLLGGRGMQPVNVFDPKTNTWETRGATPIEIHHFQPVVYEDAIYLVGAMTGGYPEEKPLENIWIYYPLTDQWEKGAEIPEQRRRGSAGAVLYEGKIFLVGGIKLGHTSGTTNYFDCYDLKTGQWATLTDAPHIRDHFSAIIADNKLYCIGGRNTSVHYPDNFGAFFNATIPQVDYYDLMEQRWYTMKATLPVPTAAGGIVQFGTYLVYMGGEGALLQAYNHTQCLNIQTGEWSQLAPLYTGRHGTGAILYQNEIYIAAGSPNRGGGNLTTMEIFSANHDWESLFNGKDLEGWQVKCTAEDQNKSFWMVRDNAIFCNSMGSIDHNYIWLINDREFSDFEMRIKFKVSRAHRGNSGIQVRSRYDEHANINGEEGWLDGPQADIDPGNPWRNGLIYDETRSARRWIYPSLPDWKIDKLTHAPERVIFYWEDQGTGWNDMTIICRGTRIKTIVNNMVISDFDGAGILDDKDHQELKVGMAGHIALQLHQKSENKIWFRDIEIRKL